MIATGDMLVDAATWNAALRRSAQLIDDEHREHPERLGLLLTDLRNTITREFPLEHLFDALIVRLSEQGFARSGSVVQRAAHRARPRSTRAARARAARLPRGRSGRHHAGICARRGLARALSSDRQRDVVESTRARPECCRVAQAAGQVKRSCEERSVNGDDLLPALAAAKRLRTLLEYSTARLSPCAGDKWHCDDRADLPAIATRYQLPPTATATITAGVAGSRMVSPRDRRSHGRRDTDHSSRSSIRSGRQTPAIAGDGR